jgi:hypothetical protein
MQAALSGFRSGRLGLRDDRQRAADQVHAIAEVR